MAETHAVGAVSVRPVVDAVGEFFQPVREAFPTASEAAWRAARALDPAAFLPDGRWRLRFRCFLVTSGETTTLVDAGIGPAEAPAASWAPVPGVLPEQLGVRREDIDVVVLTHMHTDHVGWTVDYQARQPYFPNARYVLHQADYNMVGRELPERREQVLDPLRAAGQLDLVTGPASLAAGVRVEPAPGHTPGHQVVLVSHGEDTTAITGDAFVHAIQVADPSVEYSIEDDPVTAHATRLDLLGRVSVLATAHLTQPFHRLR